MSVEVLSWNVADAFSNTERMPGVVSKVIREQPGIGIFSEAYDDTSPNINTLHTAIERFQREGYSVFHGSYEDRDKRPDSHGILAIYRVAAKASLVSFVLRNAIKLELNSEEMEGVPTTLWGFHGDDRNELGRQIQYQAFGAYLGEKTDLDLCEAIGAYLGEKTDLEIDEVLDSYLAETTDLEIDPNKAHVLGGDGNSMHGSDRRAKLLRAVYPLPNALPNIDPVSHDGKVGIIKRAISFSQRATRMADGGTVAYLENKLRFQDADPNHLPTAPTRYPVMQIDRIMTRGPIASKEHEVHEAHPGSDHRAVSTLVYGTA